MLISLIQEICQKEIKSSQRRKAMNKLLLELQNLKGLAQSSHPHFLDALNQTWIWLNRCICEKFDLNSDLIEIRLVQWINSYLYWRIKDLYKLQSKHNKSLDELIDDHEGKTLLYHLSETGITTPTRNDLDFLIEEIERKEKQDISKKIADYINNDPEELLINCYPKNYPCANCQILSQRLLLKEPPDKMSHLAKDLNINNQTLNSHFKRNCLKHLQTIAKQLGYNHE